MPRLPEYDAPDRTLQPSDKGASAFEQAGRRIGPAYNEAATLRRQRGAADADLIRTRKWPFDMLELERSLQGLNVNKTSTGIGFKTTGSIGFSDDHIATDNSEGKKHRSRQGSDVGGMSIAAAGLGRMAAAMAKGNKYRNSLINEAGEDMLDPKYKPPDYTVLEHGNLVHYDGTTGKRLDQGEAQINEKKPNAGAEAAARAAAARDWSDPRNAKVRQQQYDDTGVDPGTGKIGRDPSGRDTARRDAGVQYEYGADAYGSPNPPPIPGPSGQIISGGGTADRSAPGLDRVIKDRGAYDGDPGALLSPQGAQEARGVVDWMKDQYQYTGDPSGAGTDAYGAGAEAEKTDGEY